MAFRYTPTPTASITPTISLTPSITPTITPSSTSCPYVCCLQSGYTTASLGISNMLLLPDDTILIEAAADEYAGVSLTNTPVIRIGVCGELLNRYRSSGLDGNGGNIGGFAVQSDGKIVFATTRGLYRIKNDYSDLDTTFVSGFTDANVGISGVICNSLDEILIVGNFGTNYTYSAGTITYNNNIYKFNKDGIPDASFSGKTFGGSIPIEIFDNACVKDYDDKIMICGGSQIYGDTNYKGLIRLNDDFTLDTTFQTTGWGANNPNNALTIKPLANGQYYLGGGFSNYSGISTQDQLIRLNNNGTLDTSFVNAATGLIIQNIGLQSDGKVLPMRNAGALVRRLNTNGSFDTSWSNGTLTNPTVYGGTFALTLPNDWYMLGGAWTQYNGQNYPKLVKTDENGNLELCPPVSPTPTNTATTTITPTKTATPTITPTNTPTPTFTPTPSITPPSGELFVYGKYVNDENVLQYQKNYGDYEIIGNIDTLSCDYYYTITGLTAGDVIYFTTYSTCVLALDTSAPCPNSGFACSQTYNYTGGTSYAYITVDGNNCC